jgi:hypothetical protein
MRNWIVLFPEVLRWKQISGEWNKPKSKAFSMKSWCESEEIPPHDLLFIIRDGNYPSESSIHHL